MADLPVVLLVEDDRLLRGSIRELLQGEEISTLEAELGQEGLQIARSERLDGIVLDLTLPDMDGFAVIEALKSDNTTQAIPILVLSGLTDHATQDRAYQMGADKFMFKPFDPLTLVEAVLALVEGQ